MSVFHSCLPECDHKGGLWPEFLQLFFDGFVDFAHWEYFLVLEVALDAGEGADTIFDELLGCVCVQLVETSVQPLGVLGEPLVRRQPQVTVWLEVLYHLVQFTVVRCCAHIKQTLLHVKLPRVILVTHQLFVYRFHVLRNVVMVLKFLVLVKILYRSF